MCSFSHKIFTNLPMKNRFSQLNDVENGSNMSQSFSNIKINHQKHILDLCKWHKDHLNSTNLQKPERFFYLPKEIVQDLKFQGNSNHFCLFSRICEIFRKFKKEICSRIVGSNFSRHYDIQKLQRWAENRKIHVFQNS